MVGLDIDPTEVYNQSRRKVIEELTTGLENLKQRKNSDVKMAEVIKQMDNHLEDKYEFTISAS